MLQKSIEFTVKITLEKQIIGNAQVEGAGFVQTFCRNSESRPCRSLLPCRAVPCRAREGRLVAGLRVSGQRECSAQMRAHIVTAHLELSPLAVTGSGSSVGLHDTCQQKGVFAEDCRVASECQSIVLQHSHSSCLAGVLIQKAPVQTKLCSLCS